MILEKAVPLFVIFFLAYFLKRKKILSRENSGVLGGLLIYAVAPVAILDAIANADIAGLTSVSLVGAGALAVILLLGVSFVVARVLRVDEKRYGAFMIAFPTLEGGTLGYAMMLALFGERGLSRIALFDLGNAFVEFTIIFFVASLFGNIGKHSEKAFLASLKEILRMPLIWAPILGVMLNVTNSAWILPSGLMELLGAPLLFLAMLMLGLEFEPRMSSFGLPIATVLLKAAAGVAVGWTIVILFGFKGLEQITVVIGAALPTSIMNLPFAKEKGLDTNYTASVLSISLPFGLIFLPILAHLLE